MLNDLYKKHGVVTRMISAENPTGEKGKACLAKPNPADPDLYWSKNSLGEDCKVNPFIRIQPKTTVTLAEWSGSGVIRQFFIASDRKNFSELIVRMYWDGETTPSVNCPVGAFFCMGHDGNPHNVYSLPVVVAPYKGCNCYWSMPFKKGFRIELENIADNYTEILAYKVLFHEQPVEENISYFHATYNHSVTSETNHSHVILDNVHGCGVYVGTYLAWKSNSPRWWGEGEVKFYLNGDTTKPTICDNGTEDYFGGAWNFGGYGIVEGSNEQEFNSAFLGLPLADVSEYPKKFSMYRFHIEDCIGFESDIKVTVDTLGWKEDFSKYQYNNEEIDSVAFWYLKHQ